MPVESSFPKLDIPNVDLWSFLFERKAGDYPGDTVIYIDAATNRSYTYGEVKHKAIVFGQALINSYDWRQNDVLALFTPNCIDTPSVIWGTHWAGGIVCPANPGYTVGELVFQLKDSGAKALVTQASYLDVAKAAADAVGMPHTRIILIGNDRHLSGPFLHFENLQSFSAKETRQRLSDPKKNTAFLVYSSGTTGKPKGVILSHTNIVANVLMINDAHQENLSQKGGPDGKGDKILGFLPFYHIYGLTSMVHHAIYAGIPLVVMEKFELANWCSLVQSHKITYSYVVPPVVLQLAKNAIVSNYDLSSIRMLTSGAAPLTHELAAALYNRLKIPVRQGFGLSETSPVTHLQPWNEWHKTIGSVGKLLANQTAKYMSPEEDEVQVGETGELWIKGPNIFRGYLNNIEGTKNALTEDGYFKTGDVGHQDAAGNFFITDRMKELIKYKGFQVPPAELEGLLLSHPNIDDCAVIGIYDKNQATEIPRAYVVLAQGAEGNAKSEAEIMQWTAERVAAHKRLRGGIRFVDIIPKSPAGKILRRVLADQAREEVERFRKANL